MPKKDFTQTAFAVFQQATGEAPKQTAKPIKKAAHPVAGRDQEDRQEGLGVYRVRVVKAQFQIRALLGHNLIDGLDVPVPSVAVRQC